MANIWADVLDIRVSSDRWVWHCLHNLDIPPALLRDYCVLGLDVAFWFVLKSFACFVCDVQHVIVIAISMA